MESLFDVVVCEPVTLDTESDRSVFVSWVRGLSAREVVSQRLADFEAEVSGARTRHCCLHFRYFAAGLFCGRTASPQKAHGPRAGFTATLFHGCVRRISTRRLPRARIYSKDTGVRLCSTTALGQKESHLQLNARLCTAHESCIILRCTSYMIQQFSDRYTASTQRN